MAQVKKVLYFIIISVILLMITTNPSLMKENDVNDYKKFAKDILSKVKNQFLEVIGDNYNQIYKEAKIINSWGENK